MISKLSIYKDFKQRVSYDKLIYKKRIINMLRRDELLPLGLYTFNNEGKRKSSISKILNRCIITGRTKGHFNKFRLSRYCFKRLTNFEFINGVKKSSW